MALALRLIAVVFCAFCVVAIGRGSGSVDASGYAGFAILALLAYGTARRLRLSWRVPQPWPDAFICTAILAVAIAVGIVMCAGAIGRLTIATIFGLHALAYAAALLAMPRNPEPSGQVEALEWPVASVAVAAPALAFLLGFAAWHAPLTLYDSVSYHLFFAARWVQDHAISIIATPFSDEAQAYAPANGELLFAWLMLPFHSDVLARMGQWPFAILGAAAVYGLARRAGAEPAAACWPPVFFLLARPVAEQAVGADVDLVCAALFAASLYLLVVAITSGLPTDWVFAGISVGLYAGAKYLALVFLPALFFVALARGIPRRAAWAVPGLCAFALPWYLRNWIVAGSPIYPSSLTVAGITVARGAFTREAMLNTVFHTADVRLIPVILAHAFGATLFVVWIPFAIGGWLAMARRGWWPAGTLTAVPAAMLLLFWYELPVNTDSRFLMPAVAPALLPMAFVFTQRRTWNRVVHAIYASAAAWLLVGARASLPGALPWFMQGWLSLGGLVAPAFVTWFAVIAAGTGFLWVLARRWPAALLPTGVSTVAIAATVLASSAQHWCAAPPCAYVETASPMFRAAYVNSWRWVAANVRDSTIAYTGINLPYPLTGPNLTNRVVYVNIDGRSRWRLHDYDHAFRSGRFAPAEPRLAVSSGELLPVAARAGPRDDAIRPRYERMQGIPEAWTFALDAAGARYLFVAALSAYEIDYVWHTDRGFPIEDAWAQSDRGRFHLVYENLQVHIYSIDPARRARA